MTMKMEWDSQLRLHGDLCTGTGGVVSRRDDDTPARTGKTPARRGRTGRRDTGRAEDHGADDRWESAVRSSPALQFTVTSRT